MMHAIPRPHGPAKQDREARTGAGREAGEALKRLLLAQGSLPRLHLTPEKITGNGCDPRDLADMIHHLTLLHGRQPGVLDHGTDSWLGRSGHRALVQSTASFARDRALLTRLIVMVGPLPSTPGHAQAEAAIHALRTAIDWLGRSERTGCAFGASLALLGDWTRVRPLLNASAQRLGMPVALDPLPAIDILADLAESAEAEQPGVARAVQFGARQFLVQHAALWDLLAARAAARGPR